MSDGSAGTVITHGVAMAAGATANGVIDYDTIGNYFIATDAGVRMQASNSAGTKKHSITITENGAFYDGKLIRTGSGSGETVTAVFG